MLRTVRGLFQVKLQLLTALPAHTALVVLRLNVLTVKFVLRALHQQLPQVLVQLVMKLDFSIINHAQLALHAQLLLQE